MTKIEIWSSLNRWSPIAMPTKMIGMFRRAFIIALSRVLQFAGLGDSFYEATWISEPREPAFVHLFDLLNLPTNFAVWPAAHFSQDPPDHGNALPLHLP